MFYFFMKAFKTIVIVFLTTILSCLFVYALRIYTYKDGIPVLGYHNVLEDTVKDTYYKDNIYVMRQSTFEEEMKYFYSNYNG